MVQVKVGGAETARYVYDAFGRRISATSGGVTSITLYLGNDIVYRREGDVATGYVVAGGKYLAKVVAYVGSGTPPDPQEQHRTFYFHTDLVGSIRAVTNSQGQMVAKYEYEPFGKEMVVDGKPIPGGPIDAHMESTAELTGRFSGTVELSADGVEGTYSVRVATGDDPYDFANYRVANQAPIDTSKYRYIRVCVKPAEGAEWVRFHIWDSTDNCYKQFLSPDGDVLFTVGTDLAANRWNLVMLDLKEMVVAGTSNRTYAKGTVREFYWHTDEYATWYWDHIAFTAGEVQTFTGKPEDGITDLYYFGARFYDPGAGRFISQDPARQGSNWYVYANGNPLKYVDPDGKAPVWASAIPLALAEPTMIGEVAVVGGALTYGFVKLGEYLWEQVRARTQVDTIADTKPPDDPYVFLVHFTDAEGKQKIEASGSLKPREGRPLYLAAPWEVAGKTPREVEYSLGLKPGRGEYYFLVKVRMSQVLPAGRAAPCKEFRMNRGGGLQFITYQEIPRRDWLFPEGLPTGPSFRFYLE